MECRVCLGNDFAHVVDLGYQPWGNNFLQFDQIGKEDKYPLNVVFCNKCHTLQLDYTVKKEIMFSNHTYLSGVTNSMHTHFKKMAEYIDNTFCKGKKDKSVLDIGSNDGTQLYYFKQLGYDILGIESSTPTAKIANDNDINTVNLFFNAELCKLIHKKFDIINASGVFFHLEELHSVTEGIKLSLKPDGVFVVQFIYLRTMVEHLAFDQIYHEHLLYYTLETLNTLLAIHGLEVFDAFIEGVHGGTMIACVGHSGYHKKTQRLRDLEREEVEKSANTYKYFMKFALDIQKAKIKNIEYVMEQMDKQKRIYGFGAPVKGNTLLNYFKISNNMMPYLVERNPLRRGLYSPGMHIPILMEDEIEELPDIYYVLAWNFKHEILMRNQELIKKGVEFYFPVDIDE